MEYIDYYKVLGLDKSASTEEVRKAYRKLARKYHPDLKPDNTDAQQQFQQINDAHEVLSDPEKRKKYDQYGKDWKHAEHFAQQPGQRQSSGGPEESFGDFSSFFESLFGQQDGFNSRQSRFRGHDLQAELVLTLEDAAHSHQRTLTVNGKNVRITIPAAVENGQKIRLRGYAAACSQPGNLYITFSIPNHPRFKRLGDDLHITENLDLYTAVLGGEKTIDTLQGKLKLKVTPE